MITPLFKIISTKILRTSNKHIDNVMLLGMARETTQKYMDKGMALVQAFMKSQKVLFANFTPMVDSCNKINRYVLNSYDVSHNHGTKNKK